MAKTESRLMHLLATLCLQTLILAGNAQAQRPVVCMTLTKAA